MAQIAKKLTELIGNTPLLELGKFSEEKGLDDTLILIDKAAYLVSVKNNMVITTVANDELQGNVFTNIDGAVVV